MRKDAEQCQLGALAHLVAVSFIHSEPGAADKVDNPFRAPEVV